MSGFYIANSFNSMGANFMGASDSRLLFPVLILGGVVVILFGHLLNIALCMMGVLVHGVRLNTLEFSNHIGLRWVGLPYKPFTKSSNSNPDTKEN
jgi:V/A-type H+-transporting ATPase subunit I